MFESSKSSDRLGHSVIRRDSLGAVADRFAKSCSCICGWVALNNADGVV